MVCDALPLNGVNGHALIVSRRTAAAPLAIERGTANGLWYRQRRSAAIPEEERIASKLGGAVCGFALSRILMPSQGRVTPNSKFGGGGRAAWIGRAAQRRPRSGRRSFWQREVRLDGS